MPWYFVVRALSACGVMVTLYMAAQVLGSFYFASQVKGFRPLAFFAAMGLHAWVAVFATALAATISVWVGRRALGMLVALFVLALLSGMALIGFYNPAWRKVALLNPFTMASQALGHIDTLGPGHLLPPMGVLMALSAATLAIGAFAVRNMET
jgi:ABC-2 type transport system permease protein